MGFSAPHRRAKSRSCISLLRIGLARSAPAAVAGAVEPEVIKKPKETEEGAEGEAAKGGEKKEAAPKKEEKK
jgi:hypothetical protein